MFDNKILVLKQWVANFHPTKDIINRAPIWVRLPGLPMEFWDREIIISIASKANKVLRLDENCLSLNRSIYARACVEVDLANSLSPGTNVCDSEGVDLLFQHFVYEKIPTMCFGCERIGHQILNCDSKMQGENLKVHANSSSAEGVDVVMEETSFLSPEISSEQSIYGPWIQVKGRKPSRKLFSWPHPHKSPKESHPQQPSPDDPKSGAFNGQIQEQEVNARPKTLSDFGALTPLISRQNLKSRPEAVSSPKDAKATVFLAETAAVPLKSQALRPLGSPESTKGFSSPASDGSVFLPPGPSVHEAPQPPNVIQASASAALPRFYEASEMILDTSSPPLASESVSRFSSDLSNPNCSLISYHLKVSAHIRAILEGIQAVNSESGAQASCSERTSDAQITSIEEV